MPLDAIVFLIIGTLLAVLFLVLSVAVAGRYAPLVQNLDEDKHFFKSIYPVGFFALEKTGYSFEGKTARERLRDVTIIHGALYAEYYLRLNYAQKISVGLFILPFGFLLYPIIGNPLSLLIGFGGAALAWWYFDMQITDEMDKRKDEITRDLSNVVSKLTLLVNAGMILSEAWARVSVTGDSTLYREMQNTVMDMQASGTSESDAILAFGSRCMDPEVKKFSSTLVQNVSKGNKELASYLRKQSDASWNQKREYARQKGEAASSKLMIPIAGMMIGVMVMVVVPIFGNLGF